MSRDDEVSKELLEIEEGKGKKSNSQGLYRLDGSRSCLIPGSPEANSAILAASCCVFSFGEKSDKAGDVKAAAMSARPNSSMV
jgi:hypothetical protein